MTCHQRTGFRLFCKSTSSEAEGKRVECAGGVMPDIVEVQLDGRSEFMPAALKDAGTHAVQKENGDDDSS